MEDETTKKLYGRGNEAETAMDLHELRGGRVVVLGAAGFLGSHLCEGLLNLGAHVTAIDNFITARRPTSTT